MPLNILRVWRRYATNCAAHPRSTLRPKHSDASINASWRPDIGDANAGTDEMERLAEQPPRQLSQLVG
jgi:hypothetical protein